MRSITTRIVAITYVMATSFLALYLLLGIFLPHYPEECAWSIALDNGRVLFCEQEYDDTETRVILRNWHQGGEE